MDWLTGGSQGEVKKLIAQLPDSTKRDIAARELIKLKGEAVPQLIDALQTQDLNLLPIYQQILAQIPSASPALIKSLGTAHPLVRGRVTEILAISKDKSAIPALLDALKGEYYTVRSRAALALGNIGDARVIPNLFSLLKDKEDEVRIAACTAIGKFKDPSTFDEITNILLEDPKIEVRQSAVRALGETKHPAAIPFLMEALRDSYWWYEKEQAAGDLLSAIEKMGVAAVEPLIGALGDKEGTVRKYAARVLGNLGDVRALDELGMTIYDLHNEVGKVAAESLAKFGAPAVDILIAALKHPEAGIREHAILALGTIEDIRVAPVLIDMLGDPDRNIQKIALQALAGVRDQLVRPAIQQVASNRADREMSVLARQILETFK